MATNHLSRMWIAALMGIVAPMAICQPTQAFCGFYVNGGGKELYNNATITVLMRDETRTILSMENNYQGPPDAFAMVIPVPIVLHQENVRTLKPEVFRHIDRLSSPRLVEYWEQDPCGVRSRHDALERAPKAAIKKPSAGPGRSAGRSVVIEDQFSVDEYEIVILSAKDSGGLETWLLENNYKIPSNSAAYFKPYVANGSKFFVAKVDPAKVKFENGKARLAPLRFHYDSPDFNLPIRLGLINSSGTQDLLIHILARNKRYQVANYPNVTIPTNLNVAESVRQDFGPFYAALFDKTMEENPGAVVTEYSWLAGTCDPCPTPGLNYTDLLAFGGDVLPEVERANQQKKEDDTSKEKSPKVPGRHAKKPKMQSKPHRSWPSRGRMGGGSMWNFVLTRLHARYTKHSVGEDLVFKEASPITGGREVLNSQGVPEQGEQRSSVNNFQARYAIRHPWKGPITCASPKRGVWGGPPNQHRSSTTKVAEDLGNVKRTPMKLASLILPEDPGALLVPPQPKPTETKSPTHGTKGCNGCAMTEQQSSGLWVSLVFLAMMFVRQKRANAL
jgi:hypothetical protein